MSAWDLRKIYSLNFNHFKTSFSAWFMLDEIYQHAADMGCAACLFVDKNDVQIIQNLTSINVTLLSALLFQKFPSSIFFASSTCVYLTYN